METNVRYLGGVQFEAECRGHKIVSDQPLEAKGSNAGMSPPELLLSSLGTCAAFYAAYYLNLNKLPTEGLHVKITARKAMNPPRLDDFEVQVEVPGVDGAHREAVRKAVEKCLIHATLLHSPTIRTEVSVGEPVEAA